MDKKRIRGTNFTKEDELLLLNEIEALKHVVENKHTDKIHTIEKNAAWSVITTKFNAIASVARSQENLRIKYDNLKIRARKFAAAERKYPKATTITNNDDPILNAVLRIIVNSKTAAGLSNGIENADSQSKERWESGEGNSRSPTPEEIFNYDVNQSLLFLGVPQNSLLNIPSTSSDIIKIEPPSSPEEALGDLLEKEQILCNEEENPLQDQEETILQHKEETILQDKEEERPYKSRKKWVMHTPKRLKVPLSDKFRKSTLVSPLQEEYYKKKILYLEEETKRSVLQQQELIIKMKAEEEIHKRKIILLDLEIELKEKELLK